MLEIATVPSPIGGVVVGVRRGALVSLAFEDDWPRVQALLRARIGDEPSRAARDPAGVVSLVHRYFGGATDALDGVPVETFGSALQRSVWDALRGVPAGETISYTGLARAAGAPRAVRATGTACGRNLVGIAVPCHRAVRADGTPGGYAGGPARKEWLLAHERAARMSTRV